MAVDTSTPSWTQTTKTGVIRDVNSTLDVSSMLVDGSGDGNMQVIVYVLLGIGAVTPIILLLAIVIVLRCRRAARLATYNSAPTVDPVLHAWNSPVAGATASRKLVTIGAVDRVGNRPTLSADGRQTSGTLSELAVREFFDVQDHQTSQLYVSVEPTEGPRPEAATGAASPGTVASSTPGSSMWTSGSESSGEMERRTGDLVALIGRPSAGTTVDTDAKKTRNPTSYGDVPSQSAPSASTTASPVVESAPENGSCSGSTVHMVVVDIEPPPVNGLVADAGFEEELNDEDEQHTAPLPCLSKMRRSDACYDIAHMSSSSPVNLPDSPCRTSSKSSSPPPSPAPLPSAGDWNDAKPQPTEDMASEVEKALKCLDAIAYDYADPETREPTDTHASEL